MKTIVATVPTVYGIETYWQCCVDILPFVSWVATVPTVYGIETPQKNKTCIFYANYSVVATVPTVYGIETPENQLEKNELHQLQQYLPFTVLKR